MVSRTLCHESHISWVLYHILSYTLDVSVVVVVIDSFVPLILVRAFVLLMLSRDTSQGLVLSQIASSIKWVANIFSTVVIGQNWCLVMLDSCDPKNTFLSLASLQILHICMRNLIRSPVFMLSLNDESMAISAFISSSHRSRMIFITNFLLAISLSHSWDFTIDSWL